MKHLCGIGLMLLACCSSLRADEMLLGSFKLFGLDVLMSHGYGRSVSYTLLAASGVFEVRNAAADVVKEAPGTVVGNTAIPGPTASLSRGLPPPQVLVSGVTQDARSPSVFVFDAVPVTLPVVPMPAYMDKVLFTLPATPFTLSPTQLTMTDFYTGETLIDTRVFGSGLAYMQGAAANLGGSAPTYYIYSSEFVFSEVPEPSAALLLGALAAVFGVWRGSVMWLKRGQSR